jgi:hypothetical protein
MLNSGDAADRAVGTTTQTTVSTDGLLATGIDALALKPAEVDLAALARADLGHLGVDTLVVDYEGQELLPDAGTLEALATLATVRLTTPVRADGFDPTGDDSRWDWVPDGVGRVLVAGHPAYLTERERERAIAPRLGAAVQRAGDAWVGTESVERLALATGATQYELLSRTTERDVRALRAAGFDGEVAVYAPTVVSADDDAVLDAVGGYVSRRAPVRSALPDDARTDAAATGRAREVLTAAAEDFALVGDVDTVADRVASLREAGVTTVVGYPAAGLEGAFVDAAW